MRTSNNIETPNKVKTKTPNKKLTSQEFNIPPQVRV